MTVKQWGTGIVVMTVVATVVSVGAVALSVAPFKDSGISCGSPVVAAVHGKTVALIGNGTNELRVVTGQTKKFYTSQPGGPDGISGNRLPQTAWVVCRRPARGRLLTSIVGLGLAGLGAAFVKRRSGIGRPTRQEPTPVPVETPVGS